MKNTDYIFIIGPSAVGKTTLAKELFGRYGGAYIEQNMVPEFAIPEGVEDEGVFEEQLCFDDTVMQLKLFHDRGVKNIVALDFDDVRARELPKLFAGSEFIILRLYSSDPEQIRRQMEKRHADGDGLYFPENILRSNEVISRRPLLPNEVKLDVAGKNAAEVLNEAIRVIDHFKPETEYVYEPDDEKSYLSWVQSRNLK